MSFLHQLGLSGLTTNDFILFIPMALAGVVLTSAVPCSTRTLHYSLEICGAVVGAVAALMLIGGLRMMI
jgi:hypothetical protein